MMDVEEGVGRGSSFEVGNEDWRGLEVELAGCSAGFGSSDWSDLTGA